MRAFSKKSLLAVVAATLLASHPQLASAKSVRLAPSGNWEVNHDKDSCVLGRTFGEGEDRTGLYFTRYEPGDAFSLTLVSKYVRTRSYNRQQNNISSVGYTGVPRGIESEVQFGPSEKAFRIDGTPATGAGGVKAIIFPGSMTIGGNMPSPEGEEKWLSADLSNPYRIPAEREAAITELVFHSGLADELALETASLGKPFAVLRDCNDWLLKQWGIDVEKHRHLSRRVTPVGEPTDWFLAADYPKSMLSELRTGLVHFRLMIEPDGKVSDCTIQQSTFPEDFARTTCEAVMKRARFDPALDADGQPIRSYWLNAVRWVI